MTQPQRTCFVISPIGPDDSDIRAQANDFLELLVEPALEKYGFDVTRADRIAHPTAITSDIVRLVQESDLCLIDLTNSNPNVFYECGRRHETGKPFIQLVRKGQESVLPFDVAGIRTVTYDVSTAKTARESVVKLQQFIDTLIAIGFEAGTSGDSLSSIAQGIERIERKINQISTSTPTGSRRPSGTSDDDDVIQDMIKSPREAFLNNLRKGRLDQAFNMLDRLKRATSIDEYTAAIVLPVSMGHKPSFERMDIELRDLVSQPQLTKERDECLMLMSEGIKKYFENSGEAHVGQQYLIDLYDSISASSHFDTKTKAFVANKVSMISWSADDHGTCAKYAQIAGSLSPDDPSYLYNLSLAYQEMSQESELHETLKKLSKLSGLDSDHIKQLIKHGYQYKG